MRTTSYRQREVHTIDSAAAWVEVTLEDGFVTIEVDDRSGGGRIEYGKIVEPEAIERCGCDDDCGREWSAGHEEGAYETLAVLHELQPSHWGVAEHCDSEPCKSVGGELEYRCRQA